MAKKINYLNTDILIVGSGAAGLAAAIAARRKGARVLIVSKAMTGTRTATVLSDASLTVESPGFSREQHFYRTMDSGRFLNDPDLVQTLVEEGPRRVQWLVEEIGIEFETLIDQGYKPRGGGMELSVKLLEEANKMGVEKLEKITLFKLFIQDGSCRGAFGIADSGERWVIHSNATILAAGGFSGIFPRHDNPKDHVGDGLALAIKAGAQVRDMEFVQFLIGMAEESLPNVLIFRPFPDEVRLINESGEDILAKHLSGIQLNEAIWAMRDELARVLAIENEKESTYLDLTKVNWEQAHRWFGLQHLRKFKFPFGERPLKVSTIAHYTMGGVAIDKYSHTSLPGLYAAGEVASGVHGANRHGGNSLMDCLVFGYIAGEHAVNNLNPIRLLPKSFFKDEFTRYKSREGTAVQKLAAELHRITESYLGVLREAAGLQKARMALRDLYHRLDQVGISSPGDIKVLIELEGSILVAALVCEFALAREESRGAHYRKDFPSREAQWQRSQYAWYFNRSIRLRGHNVETIVYL